MSQHHWEVVPDKGGEILEAIGQENRLWHQFARQEPILTARVEQLYEHVDSIMEPLLNRTLNYGNLTDPELIFQQLTEAERHEVGRAYVAQRIMKRIGELSESPVLLAEEHIRLTVLAPGVQSKISSNKFEPSPTTLTGSQQLRRGFRLENKVDSLQSQPPLGGVARFSTMFRDTYIHGLVNPATGEPLVRLEVLKAA